jgi:ABC-2 type transport system permease protein
VAVYKRTYRPYEGPLTPERWRFLVLPRFAFREIFESRVLLAFLVLCLLPFLTEAAGIYIANSAAARAVLGMTDPGTVMRREFFFVALVVQGFLAFFLTAWVAPVLVSPDLVNGALPLYLSRPFTKAEYVLGKASVLLVLLSGITWVPVLLLFALQAGLAGGGWLAGNLRQAWGILAGAWIWISVLTLLGLAVSAWIRWRLVASGALAGVFFMGSAFGEAWHGILGNPWGRLVNAPYLMGLVWRSLFGLVAEQPVASDLLDDHHSRDLPVWAAWMALIAACAACAWLLNRRLQAREVVS